MNCKRSSNITGTFYYIFRFRLFKYKQTVNTHLTAMKKLLIVVAFLTIIGYSAQAQTMLIPKGGAVFSNLKTNESGVSGRTGFVAGLGFGIPITSDNFFMIQPEILYIQKGANFSTTGTTTRVGNTYINYAELPVLAKINFGGESFRAYVNAGPSVSYALFGRTNQNGAVVDVKFGDDADVTFNNRIDFGLQFGGGIGFKAGPGDILLDLRYGLGLSNLLDRPVAGTDSEAQNRVYALTLGYAIPLGSR
jgi:hypothetical protein